MTTPLPSRLRESARELRDSGTTQDSLDWHEIRDRSVARIAAELEQAADALEAGPLDALLTQILNRRVTIEQRMFDAASGKRPMPDAAELRAWAIELGTPAAQVAQEGECGKDTKLRTPRMLTSEELAECCGGCRTNSAIETWMQRAIAKFCEVNGITFPRGVPASEYLAKIKADPRRAAALQRARDRTPGVKGEGNGQDA